MAVTLTLESAKAYVRAYFEKVENTASVDIEGCALIENFEPGFDVVKLNVTTTETNGDRYPTHWDVWIEGGALYGEC